MLIGWSYAVDLENEGERVTAIVGRYREWYAPEILEKKVPGSESDIMMGARCMVKVLGGDPVAETLPDTVPVQIRGFLMSCLLKDRQLRPQDSIELFHDFDQRLERWWGERKFHPFTMDKGN